MHTVNSNGDKAYLPDDCICPKHVYAFTHEWTCGMLTFCIVWTKGLQQEGCALQHKLAQKNTWFIALHRMRHCQVAAPSPMQLAKAGAPESAVCLLLSCHMHVDIRVLNCMHDLQSFYLIWALNSTEARSLVCRVILTGRLVAERTACTPAFWCFLNCVFLTFIMKLFPSWPVHCTASLSNGFLQHCNQGMMLCVLWRWHVFHKHILTKPAQHILPCRTAGYLPDASIFKLEYGKSLSLRTCIVTYHARYPCGPLLKQHAAILHYSGGHREQQM